MLPAGAGSSRLPLPPKLLFSGRTSGDAVGLPSHAASATTRASGRVVLIRMVYLGYVVVDVVRCVQTARDGGRRNPGCVADGPVASPARGAADLPVLPRPGLRPLSSPSPSRLPLPM